MRKKFITLLASQASASFDPLSSSPALWLKNSDITTLFQDAGRTTAITTDAQTIGGITDKSGTDNHASQSAANAEPAYKANIQNGKSVCRFTGGVGADGDYLSIGTGLGKPANWTIIIAGISMNVSATLMYLFGSQSAAGANATAWGIAVLNYPSTGKLTVIWGDGTNYREVASANAIFTDDQPFLLTLVYSGGATVTVRKNGAAVTMNNVAGTAVTCGGAASEFSFGRGGAYSSSYGIWDKCEAFVFASALDAPTYQAYETYLNSEWAIY
jgi:hypothetical protein